jgi:hypothetical protein
MPVEYVERATLVGESPEGEGGAGWLAVLRRIVLVDLGLEGFPLDRPKTS